MATYQVQRHGMTAELVMIFSNTQELFSEVIGFLGVDVWGVHEIARVTSFILIFPHGVVRNES